MALLLAAILHFQTAASPASDHSAWEKWSAEAAGAATLPWHQEFDLDVAASIVDLPDELAPGYFDFFLDAAEKADLRLACHLFDAEHFRVELAGTLSFAMEEADGFEYGMRLSAGVLADGEQIRFWSRVTDSDGEVLDRTGLRLSLADAVAFYRDEVRAFPVLIGEATGQEITDRDRDAFVAWTPRSLVDWLHPVRWCLGLGLAFPMEEIGARDGESAFRGGAKEALRQGLVIGMLKTSKLAGEEAEALERRAQARAAESFASLRWNAAARRLEELGVLLPLPLEAIPDLGLSGTLKLQFTLRSRPPAAAPERAVLLAPPEDVAWVDLKPLLALVRASISRASRDAVAEQDFEF